MKAGYLRSTTTRKTHLLENLLRMTKENLFLLVLSYLLTILLLGLTEKWDVSLLSEQPSSTESLYWRDGGRTSGQMVVCLKSSQVSLQQGDSHTEELLTFLQQKHSMERECDSYLPLNHTIRL